jgi:hypothetical protein
MPRYGIESKMAKLNPFFYYYYYEHFYHYYCWGGGVEKAESKVFEPCWAGEKLICSFLSIYDLVLAIMFDRTSEISRLIFH